MRLTSIQLLVASLAFALAVALPAQAQQDEELDRTHSWYGWQTLVADSLSVSTIVLGASFDDGGALVGVGIVSLLATPAIIHAAHRNWLAMGLSLGLRVGGFTLIVIGLVQAFSNIDFNSDAENPPSNDGPSGTVPIVLGTLALISAPILDAILATEEQEPVQSSAWTVRPWASARDRSAGLTFAAAF